LFLHDVVWLLNQVFVFAKIASDRGGDRELPDARRGAIRRYGYGYSHRRTGAV